MKLKLLLSAAVATCLAWPAVSLADPPQDKSGPGHGRDQSHQQDKGGGGQDKGGKPAVAAGAHAVQGGPAAPAGGHAATAKRVETQRGAPPGQGRGPGAASMADRLDRGSVGAAERRPAITAPRVETRQTQLRPNPFQGQARQAVPRPAPPSPLSGWARPPRGPERDQAGQQWRQGHRGWDSGALWRQNPNWWRGQSSFRLYLGPRIGFFFIPDRGYVSVPREYQGHDWRAGDYLPRWFWTYRVRDYGRYGLPRPPDGCIWVWLDGDVALIDPSDGYILDIVNNLW